MKIVVINGQDHKGTTYKLGSMLAGKISGEVKEFFLPRDFGEFCTGCNNCFVKGEKLCPHHEKLRPITEAIDEADVVILTSPVYVYHCTGAMKAFLDHRGWRWMAHRPDEAMFGKQGVVITAAAGAGMKSAGKDMKDSLFFWGMGRIYEYGLAVRAESWDAVDDARKAKIEKKLDKIAGMIKFSHGKVKPTLKTRFFFGIMRMVQKTSFNEVDSNYWKEKGWMDKARPWKK